MILIGYRCTGKSETGRILADSLSLPFVDTDDLIEKTMKGSVADIVESKGWESFRKIESQILKGLLKTDGLVIATGGGIVLDEKNILAMKAGGTVVWLTAKIDTILDRMSKDPNTAGLRPALTSHCLEDEVKETMAMRKPLYEKAAHMEIDTSNQDAAQVAAIIKRKL
ncbi:MAG: shikimate kinase [Desulfobacteraceae bacterium]|nr:shikimate kinase [Desulfobacteraceae bacterium]